VHRHVDRQIGDGGDEAAAEDDRLAADPIGQPPEHDEERSSQRERRTDDQVGVGELDAHDRAEEEQRLELALVPDDGLAGGCAEEGEQDQAAVRGVAEAVAPR